MVVEILTPVADLVMSTGSGVLALVLVAALVLGSKDMLNGVVNAIRKK